MKNGLHVGMVVVVMLLIIAMLTGVCAGYPVVGPADAAGMTGMAGVTGATGPNIVGDWRSDRINPYTGMNMDIIYPERFEMGATSSNSLFTYGIAAGDLNGDGKDDVLVLNGTYGSSGYAGAYTYEYVSAVNGRDGTELWSQDITYETISLGLDDPVNPVGDLDGVAGTDVVVKSRSYDSGTDTCTIAMHVKQGSDGTELWSHSVTGNGQYSGTSLYVYGYGDLVGDDLNDAVAVSQCYDSSTDKTTCTLRVMQGSDGTEIWDESITEDGQSYMPLLRVYLCGDICGDDKNDLVVVSRSSDSASDVRAMQGSDGDVIWSMNIVDGGTIPYICPCGDLSGDGRGDLTITAQSYDSVEDETACTVYAVRGCDGHKSWNKPATKTGEHHLFLLHAYPCGDLVGSASDDLIIGSRICDLGTGKTTTATLHFLQGTDGQEFRSRSITGEDVSLVAFPYTDLDGDGNDLIVRSTSCDSAACERTCMIYAVRGSDGYEFWNQSVAGDGEDDEDCASIGFYPNCDLDGDGRDEVIVDSWSYDCTTGDTTATVTVRDGDTTSVFWSDSITGPNASMSASSYGDLDGDGKDDVVVARSCGSGTGDTTASVYVKKGDTDAELWGGAISSTGKGVWMRPNYYTGWYYQPDQDFDGDSFCDLLITTGTSLDMYMYGFYFGSIEVPTSVCAVKGNSGTPLWCEPSSETPTPPPVTGDLNGDDAITPADAVIALEIVVSGDYNNDADVNDDGVVNSLDALMILQAALGAITL